MQIVGYDTGTPPDDGDRCPALLVANAGDQRRVQRVDLTTGTELKYALGPRRCAGAIQGDNHLACDRPASPYCDEHTESWVCARCTGTCLKAEMDCYQDHAVYLAGFAPDTFKVGVTRERRLRARLREQGADRAAHLYTVSNGRIAREIEAEIAADPSVPVSDRVRVPTKVRGLADGVDEGAWTALLAQFDPISTVRFEYGLDLARRPVADTLASGTVRGVKGRVLVVENAGTTYAVDLRDLVGHVIDANTDPADRQSSLGAFG